MRTRRMPEPSTLGRGYILMRTRRRPAPTTCTAASSCDKDWGLHLTTSMVGTTPPRGGGSAAVGQTPIRTPTRMRMRRERQDRGSNWVRTKN